MMSIILDDSEFRGSVLDIMGQSRLREIAAKNRKKYLASRKTTVVKVYVKIGSAPIGSLPRRTKYALRPGVKSPQ